MKVLLTGGGTLGSVTPLLALAEELRARGSVVCADLYWIGTHAGPERALVQQAGVPFTSIVSAKFRRYLDIRNFVDPFLLVAGIVHAARIIARVKPDVIVNAGSFIGVPVIIAGALLGKRCVIAQLDMQPSLSNLIASGFADRIAVINERVGRSFSRSKTSVTGIPVRAAYRDAVTIRDTSRILKERLGIGPDRSILLILGGGTGAQWINELVWSLLPELTAFCHVILVTGRGKGSGATRSNRHYTEAELLKDDCAEIMAAADVVVTRAGMGTLAELSCLGKPTVIIPIPRSHQVDNAAFFEHDGAAVVCSQDHCNAERFLSLVRTLIQDEDRRSLLAKRISQILPKDGAQRLADLVLH